MTMRHPLLAGVAVADITPQNSVFLAGYPHVRRYSTGVHDPLRSSALCLEAGSQRIMFIANDVIYAPKASVARVRRAIPAKTAAREGNFLVSAPHPHSGQKTTDTLSNESDTAVPKADPAYVTFLETRIIDAGIRAAEKLSPAE